MSSIIDQKIQSATEHLLAMSGVLQQNPGFNIHPYAGLLQ